MGQITELDPRIVPLEKKVKIAGVAVIATAASGVVIIGGLSIIAAVGIGLVALAAVNFGIPVGARYIALKKQQTLTALAEKFSEETIREDERQEGERISILENSYTTSRAELEGAQEELRNQIATATEEEKEMLQSQIDNLQSVIDNAEQTLLQRKKDYEELKRINKLYVAFHRSAMAMEKSEDAVRSSAEFQRLETARTSIKTNMRAAMAGKTIEAMNNQLRIKPDMAKVAQIGNSRPLNVPVNLTKEAQHVPNRR